MLEFLNSNDLLKEFVNDDFDVKDFTSKSIEKLGIAEQLGQLSEALAVLDKELKIHVCGSYEHLLSQATAIDTLEEDLKNIHLRIQALLSAIERLRLKVVEPYQKIYNLTITLSRLQSACDLLRCIVRISSLTKKLENQLARGNSEISKCAQTISELDFLMSGVDLSGLDIVANDQKLIKKVKKEIEQQAEEMLNSGIKNQDQTLIGTALQVFHNLGRLGIAVNKVTDDIRLRLERGVKEALDLRELSGSTVPSEFRSGMPGRAAMPTPGNAAAFRATLWSNVEKLTDEIYISCSQIQLLQKVLHKKRDPVSHQLLGDELKRSDDGEISDGITTAFWNSVASILTKELVQAANESTFIKQAFEGEYPKLLRLISDLWKRLDQFIEFPNRFDHAAVDLVDDIDYISSPQSTSFEPEKHLRNILQPFENSYLSRSLSRLFDPVNLMFSSGEALPAPAEVETAVKAISSELTVASVDLQLTRTVAKNVVNTVHLFTTKCEQMLANGPEATQVIGLPTEDQRNNAAIIDLLHLYEKQTQKLLSEMNPNFPKDAVDSISSSLKNIGAAASSGLEPLLNSIEKAVEAILLTMHQEDWSSNVAEKVQYESNNVNQPCSPYMKELLHFINRVNLDYFSLCRSSERLIQSAYVICVHTVYRNVPF
ncbi:Conserved oligomeric Golgi complex subunit [Chamberlinius hualienensis]